MSVPPSPQHLRFDRLLVFVLTPGEVPRNYVTRSNARDLHGLVDQLVVLHAYFFTL